MAAAASAAEEAGRLILRRYGTVLMVRDKGVADIVTEVDAASERLIRRCLAPTGIPVQGEEEGGAEGAERRSFPRRVRRFLEAQAGGYADLNLSLFRYFSEEEKADLYAPDFAERVSQTNAPGVLLDRLAGAPADEPLDRVLYGDLTLYLPDDLLVKVDVAAMAYGLETRAPLLDARILSFAASLPAEWKVGWRTPKRFFREAMRGILPDDILAREKMGFGVPIPHWFRGPLLPFLRERLLGDETTRLGLFRREALARMIDDHADGRRNHANRLWALLALTEWYRAYAPTGA